MPFYWKTIQRIIIKVGLLKYFERSYSQWVEPLKVAYLNNKAILKQVWVIKLAFFVELNFKEDESNVI